MRRRLGATRSRGAVGTSADNAAAESFDATLKREALNPIAFEQRSVTPAAAA